MIRFGHGHSLALGALLCLLVQRNGWLVLLSALLLFATGVTVGRTWGSIVFWGGRLLCRAGLHRWAYQDVQVRGEIGAPHVDTYADCRRGCGRPRLLVDTTRPLPRD